MSIQKRIPLNHVNVFPHGAYLKGGVEPVLDFAAPVRPDGVRPQAIDKDTGLPIWQATVLDADPTATKKDTAVTVKFVSKNQPPVPANKTPFPWTPVEFVGLTALPYIDETGSRPRIAWSLRAESMGAPGHLADKSAA
jgi:hypothetical protein